jgi:DNA-binding transcriptional LysR family regulator
MRLFQDLSIFRQMAEHVARPNQLTSFLQLARRAKVTDDTARRALERLKTEFNNPLITLKEHRLVLTDTGRELHQLAVRLSALAENTESPPDVLTVEADSLLAASLLPQAFAAFIALWGSMVQPRICPMLEESVRRNVQEGVASFGIGFAIGAETVSDGEVLGPKVPWVLLLASNHRLAAEHEPVSPENFTANDRVFIPEMGIDWPGMGGVLKAVPGYNRIGCDATLAVRLAMSGLGASVVPDLLPEQDFVSKRVIRGLEPVQPRFFLPRRGFDGLTEPEQSLVEQFRRAAESRYKKDVPEVENDGEIMEVENDGEATVATLFNEALEEAVTPMGEILS